MALAARNTLVVLLLYVLALAVAIGWLEKRYTASANAVVERTGKLIARELGTLLDEPLRRLAQLPDSAAREIEFSQLRESVEHAVETSATVVSMEIVDDTGRVVAYEGAGSRPQQRQTPATMFPRKPVTRVISGIDEGIPGEFAVVTPVVVDGKVASYLRLHLFSEPIADLHRGLLGALVGIGLAGIVFLLGFALLVHYQLSRLNVSLTELLTGADEEHGGSERARNEFETLYDAARGLRTSAAESQRQARGLEELREAIGENISSGMVILGQDGALVYLNPTARAMLGDPGGDAFDRRLDELREVSATILDNADAGSEPGEVLQTVQDSQHRRWQIEASRTVIDDTAFTVITLADRDMLDSLHSDLSAAARYRSLTQLYAGAAHDLRAPLNAMVMNLELLKGQVGGDTAQVAPKEDSHYYAILEEELQRLSRRLEALLQHSTPRVGEREPIDVPAMVRETVALLDVQARRQNIDIQFELPSTPAFVECAEADLRQVFINLVVNAIEALPRGGRIVIGGSVAADELGITVADNGVGMPQEIVARAFDMHFTTKQSGTGIGLFVARLAVEELGGRIHVSSALGEGTTLTVKLPLAQAGRTPAAVD